MTPTTSSPRQGRSDPALPPFDRLRIVALVIPGLLLAALIALDYYVFERLLPSEEGHLVMLVVGLGGVVTFSIIIFARLSDLHARLARQSARLAALEERHRIGMDLHDGAIQSLYGVSLVIEDAAARAGTEPAATTRELGQAVDRLNATIADLRGYVLGLAPATMAGRALHESLEAIAEQARASALVELTLDVRPEAARALDAKAAEQLFYIAADALTNVTRHARARRAELRLIREGRSVVLSVRDDGVGFDAQRRAEGHGLGNMAERARALGAQLRVDSEPGGGTRVQVELPIGSLTW